MQSIGNLFETTGLGRTETLGQHACPAMPRLDFNDDHAASVWRLHEKIQLAAADGEISSEDAMPATAKPPGRYPLTPASDSMCGPASLQPPQRRARNLDRAIMTIFCSISVMSS